MQTIAEKQAELVEMYGELEDWLERYEAIIDAGKELAAQDGLCVDRYKVKGCQSQVWIRPRVEGQLLHFDAYSDAVIVRGLIALLLDVYSGHPAAEILAEPPDFVDQLGLSSHLSMNRANGLNAMIRRIKFHADTSMRPIERQPPRMNSQDSKNAATVSDAVTPHQSPSIPQPSPKASQ